MTIRLPTDGIFLYAYCPAITRESLAEVISRSASSGWPLLEERDAKSPSWLIGDARAPISVTLFPGQPWSKLHVDVVDDHLNQYGSQRIVDLLSWLCGATHARLARTSGASGIGVVKEQELDGALEVVDWFQYWSEPIVRRWGMARLSVGPFHRVLPLSEGGCSIILSAEPDDENMSRKAAAEFLGITLRPVYGVNPQTGERILVPWR
jgi:hypothetical protein